MKSRLVFWFTAALLILAQFQDRRWKGLEVFDWDPGGACEIADNCPEGNGFGKSWRAGSEAQRGRLKRRAQAARAAALATWSSMSSPSC